jgi:Asp/Glu/hydantoin racemase
MRLLLVNPNTSRAMTARMARVAEAVAPPDVTLAAVTAERGFPYISTAAEALVAGVGVLEMLARAEGRADAAIIAAFGDPGLRAARSLGAMPVVGVAEAALLTASMLGDRIGVVAFSRAMTPWYAESVRAAGLEPRFAGFRTPAIAPSTVERAQEELFEPLRACIRDAVEIDGADVVVLGGAPLAGLAERCRDQAPAPLVDPIAAATLQAATLARLRGAGRSGGTPRRSPPKETTGLDPCLARQFAGRPPGVVD